MAKINMDEIKKDTMNSAQINELQADEQTKTADQSAELTDNASEDTKDTNETTETKETKGKTADKVIVRYVGSGIWKDSDGKLWASEKKSDNILNERQYSIAEYEKREDIKFMVKYGAMSETHVG